MTLQERISESFERGLAEGDPMGGLEGRRGWGTQADAVAGALSTVTKGSRGGDCLQVLG